MTEKETILKTRKGFIMNIDESILSKLTDEQKKMVEAAQTPEELLALAKEAGYELSQGQLEAISGGGWCVSDGTPPTCETVCQMEALCPNACIVVH